jgi:hypothetical protein
VRRECFPRIERHPEDPDGGFYDDRDNLIVWHGRRKWTLSHELGHWLTHAIFIALGFPPLVSSESGETTKVRRFINESLAWLLAPLLFLLTNFLNEHQGYDALLPPMPAF